MPTIRFNGNRQQLERLLAKLPTALTGGPDPYTIAQDIRFAAANSLLSQIWQDFITKSRGGTGRDGIKWKPLTRATIAQRRIGRGDLASIGIKGAGKPKGRVRGLLTPAQDAKWRAIFRSQLAKLRMHMPEGAAKAKAAAMAWAILKSEGAKTKLDVLGGRVVDIGRDTSRMLRSFAAGRGSTPSGEPEQIFDAAGARITVGSNVPYAPHFAEKRPFWPTGGVLPAAWSEEILATIRQAMVKAVVVMVQRGAVA